MKNRKLKHTKPFKPSKQTEPLVIKLAKPRNAMVLPAAQRKAGAHRKTEKALRRQEKIKTAQLAEK